MSIEDFAICRKCDGTMERVSPENTSPLIVECQSCGHQEWAEIQVPPPWPAGDMEYRRVVFDRSGDQARAEEIRALRKLNQELGSLPVKEAAKRIGSSKSIDLGVHLLEDAQELLKRAEAWGLKARLELPEKDSPGSKDKVMPFRWIVIGGALILAVIVWILSF